MTREEAIMWIKTLQEEAIFEVNEALLLAIEALKEQITPTIKLNNQIHLCDSCKYNYPNCPSENEDVLFGNGVGNDNICCCAKYLASADRPHGEWEHHAIVTASDTQIHHIWKCNRCECEGNHDMNFCPNCGAKMGGDGK